MTEHTDIDDEFALTPKEGFHLAKVIAHEMFGAGLTQDDAICYGGSEADLQEYNHIARIMAAMPKRVVDAYNARLRKQEADELRRKADAIERGRPS